MSRTVNGIQNCKKFRDNQFLHGVSKLGIIFTRDENGEDEK